MRHPKYAKKKEKLKIAHWWTARSVLQRVLLIVAAVVLLAAIVVGICLLCRGGEASEAETGGSAAHPTELDPTEQNATDATSPEQAAKDEITGFTDAPFTSTGTVEAGLTVSRAGYFSGKFVEDGSNAQVENVLALVVTNNSAQFVELAEIAVGSALFELTCLPAGRSVLVMEKTGMTYDAAASYDAPSLQTYSAPDKVFSLYPETFTLTAADGVINLTNNAAEAHTGAIAVYYKTVENGVYIGGITYRAFLEAGPAAGETAQLVCADYTAAGSEVIYISYE